MNPSQKVLFVDDEKNILEGLRRMLRPLRKEWEMSFIDNPVKALEMLNDSNFDVIVSDMRMPGMTGAELLEKVKEIHPEMVRIILSGQSNKSTLLRSIGPMHQCLSKPCNPDTLQNVLHRSRHLRGILSDSKLLGIISKVNTMPSLPELYLEIVEELQKPEPSISRVGQIVAKDIGMCAKVLQLVNSAMFGVRMHVSNPEQAVKLLGVDIIRMLVLTIKVFSQLKSEEIKCLNFDALWDHSFVVGAFARKIAEMEKMQKEMIEDSCMGGLLHDLGKLILAHKFTHQYSHTVEFAQDENIELINLEKDVIGASHDQVGAYVMGLWGMLDPLVEPIAFHHHPREHKGEGFTTVTAVHVANALEIKLSNRRTIGPPPQVDMEYLKGLGLESRLPLWEEACMKILEEASS